MTRQSFRQHYLLPIKMQEDSHPSSVCYEFLQNAQLTLVSWISPLQLRILPPSRSLLATFQRWDTTTWSWERSSIAVFLTLQTRSPSLWLSWTPASITLWVAIKSQSRSSSLEVSNWPLRFPLGKSPSPLAGRSRQKLLSRGISLCPSSFPTVHKTGSLMY